MPASETNKALSSMFEAMARVLDLKGDGGFRAVSFQKVARLLDDMPGDVRAVYDEGGRKALEAVKGVGKSSAAIIGDFVETGRSVDYEELMASVPAGLLEMLQIGGMGPKTVQAVWRERGVTSVDELAAAIGDGSLKGIKGLGEKKIEQIKQGIALLKKAAGRPRLGTALKTAGPILERLREMEGVRRAELAGSARRGRETVGDLDFLVVAEDAKAVLDAFAGMPEVDRVLVKGEAKCSVVTHGGLQCDCRVVPEKHFGAAWMYFTGSTEHNKQLRNLAIAKGRTLNDWGVFEREAWEKQERKAGGVPTIAAEASATEAEVYGWFELPWIPPELREGRGEIEAAREGKLPELVEVGHYRGDLHTHTNASDGTATIREMAEAAKALGYKFLAITDHSYAQTQANGLDAKRLLKHAAAVREVNADMSDFELFAGTEVDILADGHLDYEDAVLAELDWVVASPHVALRQEAGKATDRLLRAVENPYVNAIGHPTGRLINQRAGLPIDVRKVAERAAATGTALEVNASYVRLDLSDVHARIALDAGCKLVIDTDAHSTDGLGKLSGGLATARRAWATRADVLNCGTAADIRTLVQKKRP